MRTLLLTPGPTPVPRDVALAMARPLLHHRAPDFKAILKEAREGVSWLLGGGETLLLASTGTGAMESAVVNLLSPGDTAVVVVGGKFGERWAKLVAAHGGKPVPVEVPWGRAVAPEAVERVLERTPDARAVFLTASESSTGVAHPVAKVAARVRAVRPEALVVVDAVSSLGALPLDFDREGYDCVVSASQKALMLPPGLGIAALSARAVAACEAARSARFYFDWRRELPQQRQGQTAFTPAISLLYGLNHVLASLRARGRETVFRDTERLARACRAACAALGLPLFAEPPALGLTAVRVPDGIDGEALVKHLRARHGVWIAGGQDQVKGKIVRIAHMGAIEANDLVAGIAALEMGLAELGAHVARGAGVAAFEAALREAA